MTDLPFVDEYQIRISASPESTWQTLLAEWERPLPVWFARLLGCQDSRPAGPRPLQTGSVLVGFHVQEALHAQRLVLAGKHRFARYRLTFHLDPQAAGTCLRAETRAEFPGWTGALYRALILGSPAHKLAVGWMLWWIRRRAQKDWPRVDEI